MYAVNPCASYQSRPPTPQTSSPSPNPEWQSNWVPPNVQAAIDAAVQRCTDPAGKSRSKPIRSKTSPAVLSKPSNGWPEGINTCFCRTKCKCRKGERATGWYEGNVNVDSEDMPVQSKLNTRWVSTDELGEDCGDHAACRKIAESDSSSDTETFEPRSEEKSKKKDCRRSRQRILYTKFTGYHPDIARGLNGLDLGLVQQLRMMDMSNKAYWLGRDGGMSIFNSRQGVSDSLPLRNAGAPRMPPKHDRGMRIRFDDDGDRDDYEMEEAGAGNPCVRSSANDGKGGLRQSRWNQLAGFDIRGGGVYELKSGPETKMCKDMGKRGVSAASSYGGTNARPSEKHRPGFESNGAGRIYRPGRWSGTNGYGEDGDEDLRANMYRSPSKSV